MADICIREGEISSGFIYYKTPGDKLETHNC